MYEFQVEFMDTQENRYLEARSLNELISNYPVLQRRQWRLVWYDYID